MIEIVSALFLFAGAFFIIVAALGVLRLPDFYLRMHAVTKAGTLGVGLIFVGVALSFGELSVITRAVLTVAFVMLTAPVSAHMIGRAGYYSRVPLWSGTLMDQMQELYGSDEAGEDHAFAESPREGPQAT